MNQYIELIEAVLYDGHERKDRTGTGTKSIFGTQSRYKLSHGFPLCTTKKVNFRLIVEELLWFLRGETNIKTLKTKIWDEWAGNVSYGGIDQIQEAIHTIKTNPTSRRIIVSAWNPSDLDEMALPPCHLMFQFYVRNGQLDCQMYQRSADLALGVPFNIASYALLTTIIAHHCGLQPGDLIHTIGDCHI